MVPTMFFFFLISFHDVNFKNYLILCERKWVRAMKLSLLVLNRVAKWRIFVLNSVRVWRLKSLPKLSFECPPFRGFCTPLSASLWNSQVSYLCCSSCNSLSREWKGEITDSVDKISLWRLGLQMKLKKRSRRSSLYYWILKCNLNINVNRCWLQTSTGK